MGIMKLKPAFKDYLWGGQKLREHYNKDSDLDILAESWEVSTHPDGESFIDGGEFDGLSLSEYLTQHNNEPLGSKGVHLKKFPLLIKFIDALSDLSVQVHPDDDYGLKYEDSLGKTEMWYVLEADPGSKIYYGTNQELTKKEFKQSIEDNTILNKLKHIEVKSGDVIFVDAGTIHAIGAGIVVCEIQQNSNITYRLYDYNRKDADGNLRDLHIDKAVDVSTLTPLDASFKAQAESIEYDNHNRQLLVTNEYFTIYKLEVSGDFKLNVSPDSFKAIVVIEGKIVLEYDDKRHIFTKGESGFIDANTQNISVSGNGAYLGVTI